MGIDNELDAGIIHKAVTRLLRKGLPAQLSDSVGPLLEMRSIIARSVKPDDSFSRVDALNKLMKQLIRKWPKDNERKALASLFGIEKGIAGKTLTFRQSQAAYHMGYEVTHFRKKIQPELLADFSAHVWQDNLQYTPRTKYAPPPIEASGDTPVLGPNDYTEQEEMATRLWSEVYGLRAEIIAGGRIKKDQARIDELPEAKGRILWHTAKMLHYIEQYLQNYGDRILQGDTEWDVEGLIRLAGWRGGVDDLTTKRLRLALANSGLDDFGMFLTTLGKLSGNDSGTRN